MLRVMTLALLAVLLAITTLSAFIRLARSGAGCEPWPQCQAQAQRAANQSGAVAAARIAHRVVAGVALGLVVALLMSTLASPPALREPGRLVLVLLALALCLAVLGRMAADSRATPVVLANLLGGFTMLALATRLWLRISGHPARRGAIASGWYRAALVLLVVVIVLGPGTEAARPDRFGPAWWSGAHSVAGGVVLVFVAALGAILWRRGVRFGAALVVLAVLEAGAGILLSLRGFGLPMELVHNALAAVLFAVLAALPAALIPAR